MQYKSLNGWNLQTLDQIITILRITKSTKENIISLLYTYLKAYKEILIDVLVHKDIFQHCIV